MMCGWREVAPENLICPTGTYLDGSECKTCKDGMICDEPGVTLENVRLKDQKWRTSANSAKIETCPLEKSCRSTGNSTDVDAGEALCEKGHEGPLCAVCKQHHYRWDQQCLKCNRGTVIHTIVGLVVVPRITESELGKIQKQGGRSDSAFRHARIALAPYR